MLNLAETDDTPLSRPLDTVSPSQVIVALLQIAAVTLVVRLLFALFPGERS